MRLNLDSLKTEIQEHLESRGLVVFHGSSRSLDPAGIYWDCERHPDYQMFVEAAVKAGAHMMILSSREFSSELLDDAVDRLESSDLNREDRRGYETRLRELRVYAGFTSGIELFFDHQGRLYFFDLRTEWFDEFCEIVDDIEAAYPEEDEDEERFDGGYFSRN